MGHRGGQHLERPPGGGLPGAPGSRLLAGPAHGGRQRADRRALGQEDGGARGAGPRPAGGVAVDAQRDDRAGQPALGQFLHADIAVAQGHFEINQGHVGLQMCRHLHRFGAVGGFADDFEDRVKAQGRAQTVAHAGRIVDNQNPNFRASRLLDLHLCHPDLSCSPACGGPAPVRVAAKSTAICAGLRPLDCGSSLPSLIS